MADPLRVELFTGLDGKTYFRIIAANGEPIAVSEGYERTSDAKDTIKLIQAKASIARVVDLTS